MNNIDHGAIVAVKRFLPADLTLSTPADTALNPPSHDGNLARYESSVRVIGLRDAGYATRLQWLREWLPQAEAYPFDPTNLRLISQAEQTFSTLVLHGNDPRRMVRKIREWRDLFPGKFIIAALTSSTAESRAELLRGGSDFVFDLATPAAVASAVLASAYNRKKATCGIAANDLLTLVKPGAQLSRIEQAILAAICQMPGKIVPYGAILRAIGKPETAGALKCLQVQVLSIRKKISSALDIVNNKNEGYCAVMR